jgi:hypothetical protein
LDVNFLSEKNGKKQTEMNGGKRSFGILKRKKKKRGISGGCIRQSE